MLSSIDAVTKPHTPTGELETPPGTSPSEGDFGIGPRSHSVPEAKLTAFGGTQDSSPKASPRLPASTPPSPPTKEKRRPISPTQPLTSEQKITLANNLKNECIEMLMMVPRTSPASGEEFKKDKKYSGTILNCPHEMLECCDTLLQEIKNQKQFGYNTNAFVHVKTASRDSSYEKDINKYRPEAKVNIENARIIRAVCVPYENHLPEETSAADKLNPLTKPAVYGNIEDTINRYVKKKASNVIVFFGTYSDVPREDGTYPEGIEKQEFEEWQEYYGEAVPSYANVRTLKRDQLTLDEEFKDDYEHARQTLNTLLTDKQYASFAIQFNAAMQMDIRAFAERKAKQIKLQQAQIALASKAKQQSPATLLSVPESQALPPTVKSSTASVLSLLPQPEPRPTKKVSAKVSITKSPDGLSANMIMEMVAETDGANPLSYTVGPMAQFAQAFVGGRASPGQLSMWQSASTSGGQVTHGSIKLKTST